MKKKDTTQYFKNIANIGMDPEVRARMRTKLSEYADYHAAEGVRVGADERSIEHIQHESVWSSLFIHIRSRHTTMKATLLIALLIGGGGTAAAAQNALPGDMLYPIKIHVNENARSAIAVGVNAEARLQAELLEERITEARTLAAQNELVGDIAVQTEARIETQARLAHDATVRADTDLAATLRADLIAVLKGVRTETVSENESTISESDTRLTSTVNAAIATIAEGSAFGTELTAGVDIESQIENAAARASSLSALLSAHTEIQSEIRTELRADVEAAEELVVEAREVAAESGEAAQSKIDAAGELLGGVESELSLMGDIEINTNTGAIIDIELHELSAEREAETDTSGELKTNSEDTVDLDVLHKDVNAIIDSNATSNIELGL